MASAGATSAGGVAATADGFGGDPKASIYGADKKKKKKRPIKRIGESLIDHQVAVSAYDYEKKQSNNDIRYKISLEDNDVDVMIDEVSYEPNIDKHRYVIRLQFQKVQDKNKVHMTVKKIILDWMESLEYKPKNIIFKVPLQWQAEYKQFIGKIHNQYGYDLLTQMKGSERSFILRKRIQKLGEDFIGKHTPIQAIKARKMSRNGDETSEAVKQIRELARGIYQKYMYFEIDEFEPLALQELQGMVKELASLNAMLDEALDSQT